MTPSEERKMVDERKKRDARDHQWRTDLSGLVSSEEASDGRSNHIAGVTFR